jgi:hypothetical protein
MEGINESSLDLANIAELRAVIVNDGGSGIEDTKILQNFKIPDAAPLVLVSSA